YPESSAMRQLRDEIESQGDSVKSWVSEFAYFDKATFTPIDTLYNSYKFSCEDSGNASMSKNRFSSALTDRYPALMRQVKRQYDSLSNSKNYKQARCIIGIRLRKDGDPDPLASNNEPVQPI